MENKVKPAATPHGVYLKEKIRRTVPVEVFGEKKSQVRMLDAVTDIRVVISDGIFEGHTDNAVREPHATIKGHYAAGNYIRLTGFSENREGIKNAFELAKSGKIVALQAMGSGMTQWGFNVLALKGVTADGTEIDIIPDPFKTVSKESGAEQSETL